MFLQKAKKIKKGLKNTYRLDEIIERKLKVNQFQNFALTSDEDGIIPYDELKDNLIVSLTTYNKRIYDVHLTIESLLRQTKKPNKIILWLAEDEFNEENIPLILKGMEKRGLEICFCKDLKSYKKLIPTLEKYPNDIVLTTDDDIIYPYDFIENLHREYIKDKNCVYFYRGHKMKFDNNNQLLPYQKWEGDYQEEDKSLLTLPTGIGGILYPPHCFYKDILNEELFMKLAPKGDDIWFKAMTLLKGIPCKKIKLSKDFDKKFIEIEDGQDIALHLINNGKNQNDVQIKQVFNHYDLWKKLK